MVKVFNKSYKPNKLKKIINISNLNLQYLQDKFLKNKSKLATLIIGYRYTKSNDDNMKFLLKWIDNFYGNLFDILIIEQDVFSKLDLGNYKKDYIRNELIYNPKEYNRGWGYNVAVKHYCKDSDVVALMDTDILTGDNFLDCILDCHKNFDIVSPYQYIYYSDDKDVKSLRKNFNLDCLEDVDKKIKNPVSISGGIVIFKKTKYLELNGFEQYLDYSSEDRAMDVTILNHIDKSKIKIDANIYVHQYHPRRVKKNFHEVYAHLIKNYKCEYHPELGRYDFIHANCKHANKTQTLNLLWERAKSFGDKNLYKNLYKLAINGQVIDYQILEKEFLDFKSLKEVEINELNLELEERKDKISILNEEKNSILQKNQILEKESLDLRKEIYEYQEKLHQENKKSELTIKFLNKLKETFKKQLNESIESNKKVNALIKLRDTLYEKNQEINQELLDLKEIFKNDKEKLNSKIEVLNSDYKLILFLYIKSKKRLKDLLLFKKFR